MKWQRYPTPGYSTCYHCNRSWNQVELVGQDTHTFNVSPGQGFFPICEPCYQEMRAEGLRTQLMTYIAALWVWWRSMNDGVEHLPLADMQAAVAREWPE
jgi:hypothetical protein